MCRDDDLEINFSVTGGENEEDEGEWEWEEEEEDEVEAWKKPEEAAGKADIKIDGTLVTIDRSKPVDWSDDEFEEDDEEPKAETTTAPPPPPPPPPAANAPPPPPPPPGGSKRSEKLEMLKKRATTRPDWNNLMGEIDKYKCKAGLLKRTQTNDRSKPILSTTKVKGVVSGRTKLVNS